MELPWCGAGSLSAALGKVLNPFGLIQLPGGRSHLAVRRLQLPRMGKNLPLSFQQLIFFCLNDELMRFPPSARAKCYRRFQTELWGGAPSFWRKSAGKISSLPPVRMVKAKSRLFRSVPD